MGRGSPSTPAALQQGPSHTHCHSHKVPRAPPAPLLRALLLFSSKFQWQQTLTLAQPRWHSPVPPSLPGGTEQPVQDASGKLQSVPLALPWQQDPTGTAHRVFLGSRIQQDHCSVCKYPSGRAQPFGMRRRKINATRPLRSPASI